VPLPLVRDETLILPRAMIRSCRQAQFRLKVSDSTGQVLSGGSLLMRILILRRLLMREVFAAGEQQIGILLPPSVGAVIVNAAVTLAGRVTANLNYTATSELVNACIGRAEIQHVLTSRRVMEKLNLDLDGEVLYLEDFRDKVTWLDKAVAAIEAYLFPAALLDWLLGLNRIDPDDVLTVIFTSGSTGDPKGVMLTYLNVASNVDAIAQTVRPQREDTILGILPFFHSFGYTVTFWGPMALGFSATYHFTPLDARAIGKLAKKYQATILLATPTFLRSYVKRCPAEDFSHLNVVVVGAEKLSTAVADEFNQKFGVRPTEGYGATELSPLVSVNVPPSRSQCVAGEIDFKEGTVGRPVEHVKVKVVDQETGVDLPSGQPGMLLVSGTNVMKGYLGQPEKSAEVLRDGWYVTGDIATIDEDGFITITGRESRFSKIGGEMIPHVRVEEMIQQCVADENTEEVLVVVTAVPDERKGEKLVVVHKPLSKSAETICGELVAAGLPLVWVPAAHNFMQVEEIPLLGSGKIDLKAVTELAKQRFGASA